MKKVSCTGDGLSVLIAADYLPHHHWMSFACWYSFVKFLPDAKVGIMCHRRPYDWQMYNWTKTLKVKMRYHPPASKEDQVRLALAEGYDTPLIVVEPDVMLVRELEDSMLESFRTTPFGKSGRVWVVNDPNGVYTDMDICCDAREDSPTPFVCYPEGWGNFVTANWINKAGSPFQHRFGKPDMTPNEVRVERMWRGLSLLFSTVSRG